SQPSRVDQISAPPPLEPAWLVRRVRITARLCRAHVLFPLLRLCSRDLATAMARTPRGEDRRASGPFLCVVSCASPARLLPLLRQSRAPPGPEAARAGGGGT